MLKTCINRQKRTQEIVKRLFDNSKKYDKSGTIGAKNQNPNKSKHASLPPAELPSLNESESLGSEMVLLLSMKGKRAALSKRITEEIKRKCKQPNGGDRICFG
ncbi:hypothetical protein AB4K20DRAFT_1905198 [Rhizopus microsporus]